MGDQRALMLMSPMPLCDDKSGAAEIMSSALSWGEASLSLRKVIGKGSCMFSAEFWKEQNESPLSYSHPFLTV